jgi:hypothetical protein
MHFPFSFSILCAGAGIIAVLSPDGEIGRHKRLKISRPQGCTGSIPVPGTTSAPKEAEAWRNARWSCNLVDSEFAFHFGNRSSDLFPACLSDLGFPFVFASFP